MKNTKHGRRVLSLLFAFVMIFGIMTAGALAVSAEEAAPQPGGNAARIGEVEYETFAAAVKAVANGETITLLKDCAESVTIKQASDKSFTVDGNGKTYTGTVTIDGGGNSKGEDTLTFTNVIFKANNSIIGTKTYPHNVTFSGCEFHTGSGYNMAIQHSYNWSFIGCRVYGTGAFMQISASLTHNLYVEDFVAEVSGNVFKIDYCTSDSVTATFKDVTIKSGVVGFYISNRNTGAINFENVNATCQYPVYIWDRSTGIATSLNFSGENVFVSTAGNEWLTAKDGTTKVTGADTVSVQMPVAKVGTTAYSTLKEAVEAAGKIEGGAVVQLLSDVTVDEKITVSGNVTVSGAYTIYRAESYTGTLFSVNSGATLTLDGGLTVDGGNNYTFDKDAYMRDAVDNWNVSITKEESAKWFTPEAGAPVATAYMITTTGGTVNLNSVTVKNNYSVSYGVVSVGAGSAVTLTGARITHVAATQGSGVIVNVSGADISVTVNEGTVIDGNHVGGNHGLFKIYSGAVMTMNGGEITDNTGWNSNGVAVGVYRGSFYLNGGLICSNYGVYGPANGRNAVIYLHSGHTFVMTGGTICHNSGRARGGIDAPYDNGTAIIEGGEVLDNISRGGGAEYDVLGTNAMQIKGGTFTQDVTKYLAPDIGLVYDETLGKYVTTGDVYEFMGEKYSTLGEIIALIKASAPAEMPTVKVLANHKIHTPITVDVSLVLDLDGKNITGNCYPVLRIQGGATVVMTGEGSIRNSDYVFVLGASDGTSAGNLIIENGSYRGVITVASVTKGTLTINGGTFRLDTDEVYNYQYLLNCIDQSYRDGTAVITVNGGTFYGFNPKDNRAEGEGTDFAKNACTATDGGNNIYTVTKHSYEATVTEATVSAQGYTTYTCSVCGASYKSDYTDALEIVATLGETAYASFWEALDAAKSGDVIVVYTTVVIDEDRTVDLKGARVNAGGTIHDAPVFRILADVTFIGGIVDGYGDGSGATNCYAFIVGNSEVSATLTIKSGTYRGVTSAISITNGTVNIEAGTYQTKHDGEGTDYGTTYLLNCIDSAYRDGTAKYNVTGGKFVGFNPENNAADGEGTNYLADGYRASDYYGDNKWYVARANVEMDGKYFATVKDALAILASADTTVHTVKILEDITVDVNYSTYNYPILVNGFAIVLDLGGKTITADWSQYTGTRVDNALIGVVNGGKITIVDSVGGGKIINNDNRSNVENRMFWIMNSTAEKQTLVDIRGGIFIQNDTTALLYIQGDGKNSTNAGVYVQINGGHFESVWHDFFNAYDGNSYKAQVFGGTFNKDPRDNEIRIPAHLTSAPNADGTWGIIEAVASVGNNGYATLGEALAAAKDGDTVVLLTDVSVSEPMVVEKSITVDLGGKKITADTYPVLRIQGGATVFITGEGTVVNTDYVFVLGASDGASAGYLTIENGYFEGVTTVVSVTKGKLTVLGGTFKTAEGEYGGRYLLNCIDQSYRDGSASIEVKGGSFYGFNPQDNAAEGEGTDFLAPAYYAAYTSDGCYKVVPVFSFRSSNLLLGNTIGIYFNVNASDLIDGVNYVAVFTIHGTEYVVPRYNEDGTLNWKVKNDNPGVVGILFEGIAAKEMTIPISVVVMLGDKVASTTATDSVKSYVERGIERGIFTAEDMDLVIQMINYGALAQQSFLYNTSDLANSGEHAAEMLDEYTRDDGTYTNYLDATNYYGASLNLENNIGFNFKFFADGLGTADKAVITYVNHTGKEFVVEISASDFGTDYKKDRDLAVIHLDTLVAADARQLLTCKIFDKDGNLLAYAVDSIESYCARAIAGLEAMSEDAYSEKNFKLEFYHALMKYSMAAYDYDPYTKK